MNLDYKIIQKRCPSCKSVNIYKRIRRDGLSRYKGARKAGNRCKILAKQYMCRKCGHEFNSPLTDQKEVK